MVISASAVSAVRHRPAANVHPTPDASNLQSLCLWAGSPDLIPTRSPFFNCARRSSATSTEKLLRSSSSASFPTPEGGVYQGLHNIQKALNSASKQAGIPEGKVGFHQLRAAFFSHTQLQGIPPLIV